MARVVVLIFLGLLAIGIGKLGTNLWRHIGYAERTGLPYVIGRKLRVPMEEVYFVAVY